MLDPDLTLMHTPDTFGQPRQGRVLGEDSFGTCPKGIYDPFPFCRIKQHDYADGGMQCSQFTQNIEAAFRLLVQIRTDRCDIDAEMGCNFQCFLRSGSHAHDLQGAVTFYYIGQELGVAPSVPGNKDMYRPSRTTLDVHDTSRTNVL
jgi:hypothetical protein